MKGPLKWHHFDAAERIRLLLLAPFWCHLAPNWRREPQQKSWWLQSGSISEPRSGRATESSSDSEPKTNYFRETRIKTDFPCSTPWERKNISRRTLYFSSSHALPLEGIFRKFRKPFIKTAFSCSIPWGENKNFFWSAVFDSFRCLPIEWRKYFSHFGQKSQQRILRRKFPEQAQLLTSPSGNKWRNIRNRG